MHKQLGVEIRNAVIGTVSLGIDDHGLLSICIGTEGENRSQGFGVYSLEVPFEDDKTCPSKHKWGIEFIKRILTTLEVDDIFELKGTIIRLDSSCLRIHGIGHAIKDQWFYPEDLAKELKL